MLRLHQKKNSEEEATSLKTQWDLLLAQYQQVQAKIRSTSPSYAALTQPQPLTLAQLQQKALDPDTLLLEYSLGETHSYVWAITKNSFHSYKLPADREKINKAARHVYNLLTARVTFVKFETPEEQVLRVAKADEEYSKAATSLSQMVLGPVTAQLGSKRLLIITE